MTQNVVGNDTIRAVSAGVQGLAIVSITAAPATISTGGGGGGSMTLPPSVPSPIKLTTTNIFGTSSAGAQIAPISLPLMPPSILTLKLPKQTTFPITKTAMAYSFSYVVKNLAPTPAKGKSVVKTTYRITKQLLNSKGKVLRTYTLLTSLKPGASVTKLVKIPLPKQAGTYTVVTKVITLKNKVVDTKKIKITIAPK